MKIIKKLNETLKYVIGITAIAIFFATMAVVFNLMQGTL